MASCKTMKLALKSNTVTILILFICVYPLFFSQVVNGHGGSHDEDEEHVDEAGAHSDVRSKGLILVKIYCLVILLVSTFVCGVSPYFLRWNETFLLLGTQFAGGIFLATSLLHFLSDSNETFEDLTENHYPFAYMLASFGYIFTMLGDCIILYVTQRSRSSGDAKIEVDVEEQERNRIAPSSAHLQPAEVLLRSSSFSDTVLLIAALCFHSVFEGIAIGVADNKADAWRSLWTISLHKKQKASKSNQNPFTEKRIWGVLTEILRLELEISHQPLFINIDALQSQMRLRMRSSFAIAATSKRWITRFMTPACPSWSEFG